MITGKMLYESSRSLLDTTDWERLENKTQYLFDAWAARLCFEAGLQGCKDEQTDDYCGIPKEPTHP